MTRRSLLQRTTPALLVAALALCAAQSTAAPSSKSPVTTSHDSDTTVRDLMRTGVAEYKKGNLQAARDAFLQAWAIKPHYAIAASLAEVEMALGQYRSTAEHLEYYLSNLPEELGDKRTAAETQLAEAKKHLAVLRITVDAPDATVYVDGVAVEPGRELLVEPGSHALMAERNNVRTKAREVVSVAGQALDERLETKPEAPAPASAPPAPLPAPQPAPMSDSGGHAPVPVLIVGGALTLVAVGVGVGYALDSSSARSDADQITANLDRSGNASSTQCAPATGTPPPECTQLHDSLAQSNRSHDIAIGAFITGGVLAAGTIATYFLWPVEKPRSEHASVRVAPWVDRRGAGSTLAVSF